MRPNAALSHAGMGLMHMYCRGVLSTYCLYSTLRTNPSCEQFLNVAEYSTGLCRRGMNPDQENVIFSSAI